MKQMFFISLGIFALVEIMMWYSAKDFVNQVLHGSDRAFTLALLIFPCIFLSLWMIGPTKEIYFERKTLSVRFHSKKFDCIFPWDQVVPTNHWILSKAGTHEWMYLTVVPPFPEEVARDLDKRGRAPEGKTRRVLLGSIVVKNPEHAIALYAFLDTWMRSRQSAIDLYQSMVRGRFGI